MIKVNFKQFFLNCRYKIDITEKYLLALKPLSYVYFCKGMCKCHLKSKHFAVTLVFTHGAVTHVFHIVWQIVVRT